ncbi:MAG: CheR family methyltransferase [Actinomycetota bacterium]
MAPTEQVATGVCGIGASAGGLEPIAVLVENLEPTLGVAVVVAQQLPSDHERMLVALLEQRSMLPVRELDDGQELLADHVYVLGQGHQLTLDEARATIVDRPETGAEPAYPKPIDLLFASLASWGSRAAAVVLSGTGDDGAIGVRTVRDAGGLALAQDDSAPFPDMPAAAVRSGAIDGLGGPADLAEHLSRYFVGGERPVDAGRCSATEETILDEVESPAVVTSGSDERATVRHRLVDRMRAIGRTTVRALATRRALGTVRAPGTRRSLATRVRAGRDKDDVVADDTNTGVTSFFRDPEVYDELAGEALPALFRAAAANGETVRSWSAGCATGQEAYSLAMILVETRDRVAAGVPIEIFATDVDDGALSRARAGLYTGDELEGVDPDRRERFFRAEAAGFRVRPQLRDLVEFSKHNVLTDAPFTRIDLVLCRNTLSSFTQRTRHSALSSFGFALRDGGLILLGERESLGAVQPDFGPVGRSGSIQRKLANDATAALGRVRRPPATDGLVGRRPMSRPGAAETIASSASTNQLIGQANDAICRAEGIGALVLDDTKGLASVIGQAADWLELPAGAPPSDATRLIRNVAMRAAVNSVLRQLDDNVEQPSELVSMTGGGGNELIEIRALRLDHRIAANTIVYGRSLSVNGDDEPGGEDRGTELVDANEELLRLNESLNDFTGIVSHDLRSPLRHIRSFAAQLREDIASAGIELPESAVANLEVIERRADDAIGLVGELLDYARSGTPAIEANSFDLQTMVTDVVELVDGREGMTIDVQCDVGSIVTERVPLATCIRNLVDNALKHHPGPPGTVTVRARLVDADALQVTVADDGNGVDPESRTRLLGGSPTIRSVRSGLGLVTIRRILDRRGGSIDIESEPGRGAAFVITWPVVVDLDRLDAGRRSRRATDDATSLEPTAD